MSEVVEDCRALAAALAATPIQDVPIYFTYAPYNYATSVVEFPVVIINDISYFYIRREVEITDELLKVCHDLIRSLLPVTYKTIKVGYFNDFFDFRSYSQPPEILTNPEFMAENAGAISDVLTQIPTFLDPTTRQLYQLSAKSVIKPQSVNIQTQPPTTKKIVNSRLLPIPTLAYSNQTPEAIKQWNIIRNFAYRQEDFDDFREFNELKSNPIIETPEILAHLLRYKLAPNGYRVGQQYRDNWLTRKGLAEAAMDPAHEQDLKYDFGTETVLLLAPLVHFDVNAPRAIYEEVMINEPFPSLDHILVSTTDYQLLTRHGFAHHDTIFQTEVGTDFHALGLVGVSYEDKLATVERYPFFLTLEDIPELPLETRLRLLKTKPFGFTDTDLLEAVMTDSEISGGQKAYIMSFFYDYHAIRYLNPHLAWGYQNNMRPIYDGIAKDIKDDEFVNKLIAIFKQYLGLHPFIDSCIQHKLNILFGLDAPKLSKSKLLVIAPAACGGTGTQRKKIRMGHPSGPNHLYLDVEIKSVFFKSTSLSTKGYEFESHGFETQSDTQLFDETPDAIPYCMYNDSYNFFNEGILRIGDDN